MTDQVEQVASEDNEGTPIPGEEDVSNLSPAEQKAAQYGWKPKEEWEGSPEDWISAAEFNRRSELFGKISSQRHEVAELKKAIKQMHSMMVANNSKGYQNAIDNLKYEREQALAEGDTDKVILLDGQLEATQQHMKQSTNEMLQGVQVNDTPEYYQQWREQNSWYGSDAKMTAYADAVAKAIVAEKGNNIDKQQLLKEIAEDTLSTFNKAPKKRGSPQVLGTAPTSGSSTTQRGKGISSLSPADQQIARTLMNVTGMSEKEYMKQYNEVNK